MSLYAALTRTGASGFGYASTADDVTRAVNLDGRTVLLTGCTSGIGKETMRVLHMRGADVLAAARSERDALRAAADVGARVTPLACDLGEPLSVLHCARAVRELKRPLDVIVCNAGIMALPTPTVKHGLELQFLTNHLGHFVLVTELLELLAADARVVVVSSGAHRYAPRAGIDFDNLDARRGYRSWRFYGQSKLANLLFAEELARRFQGSARVANALHPGVIDTGLARHTGRLVKLGFALAGPLALKSIAQGAATQCYLAAHPDGAMHSGRYFANCNVARTRHRRAHDEALASELWARSEELKRSLSTAS